VRFPDFFILGAPKCGTTTLYAALSAHEAVHFPRKEPGALSQDIESTARSSQHIASLEDYGRLYARCPEGRIAGDATPRYLYSADALSAIARHRPDARLVVTLRDPVDLALSYHAQKVREARERERDFERAWARSVDRRTGRPLSDGPLHDGAVNYPFFARVGRHLVRWHEAFGPAAISIVLLPEMKADMRGVYTRVLSHIGVRDDGREEFAVANARVVLRSVFLHQTAIRLNGAMEPLLDPVRRWRGRSFGVMTALNRVNVAATGRERATRVSAAFRAFMQEAIADDVAVAERFLDGRRLQGGSP